MQISLGALLALGASTVLGLPAQDSSPNLVARCGKNPHPAVPAASAPKAAASAPVAVSTTSAPVAMPTASAPAVKAAGSAGCGKNPPTSGVKTVKINGKDRQYTLRVPNNYDNKRQYKLMFGFHFRGGSMNDIAGGGSDGAKWAYYGMQREANESAILVAPNGLNGGWANAGGEDMAFVDAMVASLKNDLCVDERQLYSIGFSYGAGMTYSLACSRAKVFRGVAVLSGAQLSGCDNSQDPIAYLGVHGVSDNVLPIAGGRSLRDHFVRVNGCGQATAPEPKTGSGLHNKTEYPGCKAGYPTTFIAFDGGHYPAPVDHGPESGAKSYIPGEIYSFFSKLT